MIGERHILAWRMGSVIALTVAMAIALALILAFLKFDQRLLKVTGDRLELVLDEVDRQTETGLALGLELAELEGLSAALQRAARARDVTRIEIWNEQGRILFSTHPERVGSRPEAIAQGQEDGAGPNRRLLGDELLLSLPLTNGFGRVVGAVGVTACLGSLRESLSGVRRELLAMATPLVSLALLATLGVVFLTLRLSGGQNGLAARDAGRKTADATPGSSPDRGSARAAAVGHSPRVLDATFLHPLPAGDPGQRAATRHDPIRTLVFRLTAVTLALLLVLSLLASWLALHQFERVLYPELRLKAQGVSAVLTRQIDLALGYGIPLAELPGLDAVLAKAVAAHPDIVAIALETSDHHFLAAHGQRPAIPVAAAASGDLEILAPLTGWDGIEGWLRLSLDPDWVAKADTELILEVASVILVSVLVAFEVLLLVAHLTLGRSWPGAMAPGENAATGTPFNLVFLRLPVFLFCLSEEVTRPFIPTYAQALAPTAPWLPLDLAVSLPISLFMLIWALSQPLGARFSGWFGRRPAFIAAALLSGLGLILTALTDHLLAFMAWRCLTALGYGLALITAQGLVVDHTRGHNRASGLALFIGALLAAGVCGPVAGGIIADQAGPTTTLLVGAVLALTAAAALALLLPTGQDRHAVQGTPARTIGRRDLSPAIAKLVTDRRFTALMIFSAIPAKVAATGVLFCLLPLLLTESGADKAEIGRTQMMYFLFFIIASPLAANLSDRWQIRRGFIIAGGLATLGALTPLALTDQVWGPFLAIALFGAAQALISAPQLSLVTQIATQVRVAEISAIGWYRLLERLGGALGPLVVIGLAAGSSYREAALGIGLLCGGSALLFWLLYRRSDPAPALLETPP